MARQLALRCAGAILSFIFSGSVTAQSEAWSTRAPMPTARLGGPTAIVASKLFVISGCCITFSPPYARFGNNEAYNPDTNSWTNHAPIPTPVYGAAVGVIDGKVYVAGGQGDQSINNTAILQVYDPVTDSWQTKAPLPSPTSAAGGAVIDGKLYVVGGMNSSNTAVEMGNALRVYDPGLNSWVAKTPMPTPRAFVTVTAINGKLYAAGGGNGGASSTLEVYDPASDVWTTKPAMQTARYGHGAAAIDGILYVAGGHDTSNFLSSIEAYDPASDTWSQKEAMPTARSHPQVGVLKGLLHVAGGQTQSETLTNVLEVYSPFITVAIDIKPGSAQNTINLGSAGVVPVAVLSSASFDATQVNPETLTLAGAAVRLIGRGGKYSCSTYDANADGRLDLVCHVETAQFMLEEGEGTATLAARTYSGQSIRGEDAIRIVP